MFEDNETDKVRKKITDLQIAGCAFFVDTKKGNVIFPIEALNSFTKSEQDIAEGILLTDMRCAEETSIRKDGHFRVNENYRILKSNRTDTDNLEIVLGFNPSSPTPYVTWVALEYDKGRFSYGHGNYFKQKKDATADLVARTKEYTQELKNSGREDVSPQKKEEDLER